MANTASELQQRHKGRTVAAYTHDVSTIAGANALAASVRNDWEQLDVLVNNAAVYEEQCRCASPVACQF